jgi:hypothetical protein
MTVKEVLQDLHALEARLRRYEAQYGVASEEFHELYRQGLLDNEGLESTTEFARWASAYTMKLERQQSFRELSRRYVSSLRTRASHGAVRLTPSAELQEA